MKKFCSILIIGSFGLTISCANKSTYKDKAEYSPPLPPPVVEVKTPNEPVEFKAEFKKDFKSNFSEFKSYTCDVEGVERTIVAPLITPSLVKPPKWRGRKPIKVYAMMF